MKILHVVNNLNIGGAEKLVSDLIPKLTEKNCQVDLLVINKTNSNFSKEFKSKGINILYGKDANLYSFRHVFMFRKILNKYDLVHVHLFPSMYWTVLAALLFNNKVPIVMTEHSTYNSRRKYKLFNFIEKIIYNRFSKIICISNQVEEELTKWLPSLQERKMTEVVYNGIDISLFRKANPINLKERLDIPSNNKLILMVGRFTRAKDHETLINSLAILPKKYNLILVGEGENKQKIVELCKSKEVLKRVRFLESNVHIPTIIKSVDLFVLSSHWEGFGLASVEAMAAGIPVLGSDIPGLSEVINNKNAQFTRGDHVELSQKILSVFNNKQLCDELKEYSLKRSDRFNLEKMVEEYYRIYKSIFKIGANND